MMPTIELFRRLLGIRPDQDVGDPHPALHAALSTSAQPILIGCRWPGVTAAALHVVAYPGTALRTGLSALEGLLTHRTLAAARIVIVLSTGIGMIVTARLQGRAADACGGGLHRRRLMGALWGAWVLLLGPALNVMWQAGHSPARCKVRVDA